MLTKLRAQLINRERGSGELFAVLMFTPLALFLLFMLINFSTYFQAKASVQQAAQSGARLISLYGGTSTNNALNTSGQTVAVTTRNLVYKNGKCLYSGCTRIPTVTCTPTVVTELGQVVTCTIKYWYSPVASSDPYGFTNALSLPFTVTGSYISETRYQN